MNLTEWHPLEIFKETSSVNSQTAILILNQPITKYSESKLIQIWLKSKLKICVDGGSNRLFEWCLLNQKKNNNLDSNFYLPDYVCGDLDSVEAHVEEYYKQNKVKFIKLKNQDLTDFDKTLKFTVNCISRGELDLDLIDEENGLNETTLNELEKIHLEQIYCFSDFTGRLDHALGNLNTLYNKCLLHVKTYLISSESLTFLLREGENKIYINSAYCGKNCGFFPLGIECVVSTSGLKWNLNEQTLKFGTFVSSSNEFQANIDFITIRTNHQLLFTMSII